MSILFLSFDISRIPDDCWEDESRMRFFLVARPRLREIYQSIENSTVAPSHFDQRRLYVFGLFLRETGHSYEEAGYLLRRVLGNVHAPNVTTVDLKRITKLAYDDNCPDYRGPRS